MTTLPPHKYRELINELRDTAQLYTGAAQLRARLEKVVGRYVQPTAADTTRIPKTQKDIYEKAVEKTSGKFSG